MEDGIANGFVDLSLRELYEGERYDRFLARCGIGEVDGKGYAESIS